MAQRKPYNPNTKYGRRKMREQAWENYNNASPEEKKELDNIKAVVWIVLIIIVVIVFIIKASTQGVDEAVKWAR